MTYCDRSAPDALTLVHCMPPPCAFPRPVSFRSSFRVLLSLPVRFPVTTQKADASVFLLTPFRFSVLSAEHFFPLTLRSFFCVRPEDVQFRSTSPLTDFA